MTYELVMGLEVHVELATKSKLFCACSTRFGAGANENVCPACAGMPGMPAVTNKQAVELGIRAALLTNSEIARVMTFDKKNYFYPDLPAAYQITQWFSPICKNGRLEIETASGKKTITLKQIHIEEDAGKLVHDPRSGTALVDFNRTSVPLVEIVSNPDFRSAEEVVAYLTKLRSILSFAGVSDCKMQEGSMRCDVNISVRPEGDAKLGTRTEIKNMNSLKAITRAIAYEYARHVEALETGREKLVQETRRWDDARGETSAMREKENATDYRYFPNPELMPIVIDGAWIEKVRAELPEPAEAKRARLMDEAGLSAQDAGVLTGTKALADLYDGVVAHIGKPKEAANWIIADLLGLARGEGLSEDEIGIDVKKFARVIELVRSGAINRTIGKKVLARVLADDADPDAYIAENNLGMLSDDGQLDAVIAKALASDVKSVRDYQSGNEKVIGFFVGRVMREMGGRANPAAVNEKLALALKAFAAE